MKIFNNSAVPKLLQKVLELISEWDIQGNPALIFSNLRKLIEEKFPLEVILLEILDILNNPLGESFGSKSKFTLTNLIRNSEILPLVNTKDLTSEEGIAIRRILTVFGASDQSQVLQKILLVALEEDNNNKVIHYLQNRFKENLMKLVNQPQNNLIVAVAKHKKWELLETLAQSPATTPEHKKQYGKALVIVLQHARENVFKFESNTVLSRQSYIQLACQKLADEAIQTLLKSGAAVGSTQDGKIGDEQYGNTALHWALIHCKFKLAIQLIQSGANPMFTNKEGKTALDLAVEQKNWEFLKDCFIEWKKDKSKGADPKTVIELATKLELWECITVIAQATQSDKVNGFDPTYGKALVKAIAKSKNNPAALEAAKALMDNPRTSICDETASLYRFENKSAIKWGLDNRISEEFLSKIFFKEYGNFNTSGFLFYTISPRQTYIEKAVALGYWNFVLNCLKTADFSNTSKTFERISREDISRALQNILAQVFAQKEHSKQIRKVLFLLFNRMTELNIKAATGQTLIQFAASQGKLEYAQYLDNEKKEHIEGLKNQVTNICDVNNPSNTEANKLSAMKELEALAKQGYPSAMRALLEIHRNHEAPKPKGSINYILYKIAPNFLRHREIKKYHEQLEKITAECKEEKPIFITPSNVEEACNLINNAYIDIFIFDDPFRKSQGKAIIRHFARFKGNQDISNYAKVFELFICDNFEENLDRLARRKEYEKLIHTTYGAEAARILDKLFEDTLSNKASAKHPQASLTKTTGTGSQDNKSMPEAKTSSTGVSLIDQQLQSEQRQDKAMTLEAIQAKASNYLALGDQPISGSTEAVNLEVKTDTHAVSNPDEIKKEDSSSSYSVIPKQLDTSVPKPTEAFSTQKGGFVMSAAPVKKVENLEEKNNIKAQMQKLLSDFRTCQSKSITCQIQDTKLDQHLLATIGNLSNEIKRLDENNISLGEANTILDKYNKEYNQLKPQLDEKIAKNLSFNFRYTALPNGYQPTQELKPQPSLKLPIYS